MIACPRCAVLATQLNTARGTVELAYTILVDEGYLQMRGAAGTLVSPSLPPSVTRSSRVQSARDSNVTQSTKAAAEPQTPAESRGAQPAPRQLAIAAAMSGEPRPLQPGLPALDAFPLKVWNRLVSHRARSGERAMLAYPDPAGYRPLREQIATYLGLSRGVTCRQAARSSPRLISFDARAALPAADFRGWAQAQPGSVFRESARLAAAGIRGRRHVA